MLSAPLAWEQAPKLCYHDDDGRRPCADYHRLWQYLPLFGVSQSIRTDTGFLLDAFRRLVKEEGARRVLVSGTADYAMLMHVLKAFELEAVEPEVIVVDRCATPIMLNRWFAERTGATIQSTEADVLSYRPERPVDIVCTHTFLGWFSPADKRRLIRSWHDMLVPGGTVITTCRLFPGLDEQTPMRFDQEEARSFRERIRAAAEAFAAPLPASLEELSQTAESHTQSFVRYPIASRESLMELFAVGGFPLLEIDDGTRADEGYYRPSAVARHAGNRLRLIARRPA